MPYKFKNHRRKLPGRKDESGRRFVASNDAQRAAIRIRNSYKWRRFRRRFLIQSPWCFNPFGDHGEQLVEAREVHHIVGLVAAPDRAFDEANCTGLCSGCHHKIERLEQTGHPTQALFEISRG